ncbi:MAG: type II secretion system protein M [Gammaproteobacteria bacterium]|nr:type II secretion system protein M [Gammaproteobacteria bacterium]
MSAKEWYLRQSQRDRWIVIGLVALVALSLLYALVWNPLMQGLEQNRNAVVQNERIIEQMLASEAQVKALRGAGGLTLRQTDKAPYLLIDEIIRKLGMKNPDRVEPIDTSGARVNFSDVEFDKLILALGELEEYGLNISTLNVNRKEAGMVSARFRVDRN